MQLQNNQFKELPKQNVLLFNTPKNIKHVTKVFSDEEIQLIFNTIRNNKEDYLKTNFGDWIRTRDLCIIALIYYEALRPKEACKLSFNDIDFQNKTIFINGKNNKTGKDRIVRLSKQVMPFLEEYFSYPKRYWKNSDYLFPSMQNKAISPATFKAVFREKCLKKCGLWEKPPERNNISPTRLYSLRKSRASHLLQKSKDLFCVANVLGHSDIRTTASYYIHTDKEYQKYVQGVMDDEVEALKTPQIQVNQTNNVNVLLLVQQIQKQTEMMLKVMEKFLEKNG